MAASAPQLRPRPASRAACMPLPTAATRRLFELLLLLATVAAAASLTGTAAAQTPTDLAGASVRARPAGYSNADVLVVDFDGDGFKDLLTTGSLHNTLGALRGLPGGRFEPPIISPIGPPSPVFPLVPRTYRAAAADVDLDGELDVVAGSPETHVVTTMLGDGTGGFMLASTVIAVGQPVDVALADFNGDGFLDLVTTEKGLPGPTDAIVVRRGDGVGNFGAAFTALTNSSLGACAVADFNVDGKLDVMGAAKDSLPVAFGNGTFGFIGPLLNPAAGADKYALTLADVSGDMLIDAVLGDAAGAVLVRLGAGGGNFALPLSYAAVPPGTRSVVDVVVADATNDGRIDIVTANSTFDFLLELGPDSVSVLPGAGGGLFLSAVRLGAGENPVAVATADLDRDGLLDVVAAPWALGNAALMWGRPNAAPRATELYTKPFVSYSNRSVVALADLSADGDLDVLAIDYETGELDVHANDGAGHLAPAVSWFTDTIQTFSLDLGDMNGDPWPDAVITGLPAISTYPVQVHVLLGTPAGGFGALTIKPLPFITGFPHAEGGYDSVALGDWNGDGRTDAVVTADFQSALLLLLGDGMGGFGAPTPKTLPGLVPHAVDAGDMNGDGAPDLVVAGAVGTMPTPPGFVEVLVNDGAGNFTGSTIPMGDHSFSTVELADLDLDGELDVLALRSPTHFAPNDDADLWTWLGDGLGFLWGGTGYEIVGGVYLPYAGGVGVGDLNGDGLPDAAVSVTIQDTYIDDRLSVLPGDGQGGFGAPFDYSCSNVPLVVVTGDLEGDGLDEVVVGSNGSLGSVLRTGGPQPWRDLGDALAGSGLPLLVGQGHLQGGTPMKLSLVHARPSSLTYLFVSLTDGSAPFKGGVLHPVPVLQTYGFFTNPLGQLLISTSWPASVPPGLPLVLQCAVADPFAPAGAALSNGVKALTQ